MDQDQASKAVHVIVLFLIGAAPLVLLPVVMISFGGIVGKVSKGLRHQAERAGGGLSKAYQNSNFGKYRQQKAAERNARIAAGNYAGSNRNPANWRRNARSAANRRLNSSGAYNAVTGGYGASRALSDRTLRNKDREDAMREFANDTQLADAWLRSGGDTNHAAYTALSAGQQQAFRQMRLSRRHQSAESFIAAQQLLSSNGEGDLGTLQAAAAQVQALAPGSAPADIASMVATSVGNWRSNGRGDVHHPGVTVGGGTQEIDTGGWDAVRPDNVSRHAIDPTRNPVGRGSFRTWSMASENNQRSVIGSLNRMEGRARTSATAAMNEQAAALFAANPSDPLLHGWSPARGDFVAWARDPSRLNIAT